MRGRLRHATRIMRHVPAHLRECRSDGMAAVDVALNLGLAFRHLYNTAGYVERLGRIPNYVAPRLLSDKVNHRKLFDRSEFMTLACDKFAARDYARTRALEIDLVELQWSGATADIPFDDLRPPYVVKPNNRSGVVLFVRTREEEDRDAIRRAAERWLSDPAHGQDIGEWGYRNVPPRVMVETMLASPGGGPPPDFKIFAFGGTARFVYYSTGRYATGEDRRGFYDRDWNRLGFCKHSRGTRRPDPGPAPRPPSAARAFSIADRIAEGTDFLRVDLYCIGDRVHFGELTPYPYAGFTMLVPCDFPPDRFPGPTEIERELGECWILPERRRSEMARRLF